MTDWDMPEPVDRQRLEEALHLRIGQLEDETNRLRRLTLLLGVGMLGAIALAIAGVSMSRAQAGRSTITASEFVLQDGAGVTRGGWQIREDGSTTLTLNDRNGIGRAKLTVLDGGAPGISLTDGRGRSRVVLSLLPDMTSTLAFADEQGNARTVLGFGADGTATLAFADALGLTRASLGVDAEGVPAFTIVDDEGTGGGPQDPLPRP